MALHRTKPTIARVAWPVLVFALASCKHPKPPVPPPQPMSQEMVVAFAQPATVKIFAIGDLRATVPHTAHVKVSVPEGGSVLDSEPTVVAEFNRDQAAGVVPEFTSQAEYCWDRIADDPSRYLEFDPQTDDLEQQDAVYASGSGVVVSPDGVILTCKHVVSDSDDPDISALEQSAENIVNDVSNQVGGPPSDAQEDRLAPKLVAWMLTDTQYHATFKSARVFVADRSALSLDEEVSDSPIANLSASPMDKLVSLTYPAQVLSGGEVWPGKDVAVLKIDAGRPLIALPLGDSNLVSPGGNIYCLGFPGAAIMPGMKQEADYKVIYHNGAVGQTMPMEGGWNGIHITAEINHGDSGGPVLNEWGEVVGLNVAGKPEAPAENYAVPISLAEEFLNESSVSARTNDLTEAWRDGLTAFFKRDYKTALARFEQIRRVQAPSLTILETDPGVNRYVQDKIDQCQEALDRAKSSSN